MRGIGVCLLVCAIFATSYSYRKNDSIVLPNDFYSQWAVLKQTEGELLRNYIRYLTENCGNPEIRGTGGLFPTESTNPPNVRPLGPRDFHIVPPGPTQETGNSFNHNNRQIVPPGPTQDPRLRTLGSYDKYAITPCILQPAPTQDPSLRPLGPYDRHVVPPGPTEDPRLRPLGTKDRHIVPPGATDQPQLRPLGPYDRHIQPPGPTHQPRSQTTGPYGRQIQPPGPTIEPRRYGNLGNYNQLISPPGPNTGLQKCQDCFPGFPGVPGEPGRPGLPGRPGVAGLSESKLDALITRRARQHCSMRRNCQRK